MLTRKRPFPTEQVWKPVHIPATPQSSDLKVGVISKAATVAFTAVSARCGCGEPMRNSPLNTRCLQDVFKESKVRFKSRITAISAETPAKEVRCAVFKEPWLEPPERLARIKKGKKKKTSTFLKCN